MDYQDFLKKAVLENAVRYKGTANPKSLVGKVVGAYPEKKTDMKGLLEELTAVAQTINALSVEEQQSQLDALGGATVKEKREGLKELDAITDAVVMRFAPSVSGPHMHIGHAITGGLTSLYCKKYNGTFIFRLEDTNSDSIEEDAYENFKTEAAWIFGNVSEFMVQSDRIELYYSYAKRLLTSGHLYVCECSQESFKTYVDSQSDCPCRLAEPQVQLERFARMLNPNGYAQGEAVVRYKSQMDHLNPAMRDFPLFRINDTPHVRTNTKYRVWPLMNFSVFVDDFESGMTHIIRAKEHMDNAKRQAMLYQAIGATPPQCYFVGRYNIIGLEFSKRKTKEAIDQGKYTGWDDIRIPFLQPLKNRGYQPGAFLKFCELNGLSQTDKTITKDDFFAALNAYNKDIIDPIARRYFFIQHPIQLTIDNLPPSIELDSHPAHKGGRPFTVKDTVFIEQSDEDKLSKTVRLYDYVTLKNKSVVGTEYESYKNDSDKQGVIHWLPADDSQIRPITIRMPDNTIISGIAEKHVEQLLVGDIIQFERFGFCRLHKKDANSFEFWYAHS